MKKSSLIVALGLALAVPASSVLAQAPAPRIVRLVVPLPAGSSNDFTARVLAPHVSTTMGMNFIVDNKAGGNGNIGSLEVVRAAPDGATLLFASNSPLAANMAFNKNMPYDPRRDFTPIANVSLTNHVVLVKTSHPAKTFAEFIAYAKARPGRVSVGSSTASVQVQIATMNKRAGIELMTVPYKGTPATFTDVIGGVIDATLTDPGNAVAQVKGGQMRALAVSSLKRNPITPDWPAISETLPGFDFPSWNAVAGPVGLPRDYVVRLANAFAAALKTQDVITKLAGAGTVPYYIGPDELKGFIESETEKWVRLAREAGVQPE